MSDHIPISWLNDFVFCPYSIYLHNVYVSTDESLYHALPQVRGRVAHTTIDNKVYSDKSTITALSVVNNRLGLIGKIDIYKPREKLLIERKYRLDTIFRGQLYQLWSEYYCMQEMGYIVERIEFHEIGRNRYIPTPLPGEREYKELADVIDRLRKYDPQKPIKYNLNKCRHCVYCNLCDKIGTDNVYT